MCVKKQMATTVMFTNMVKGTGNKVILYFTNVSDGKMFKWVTTPNTQAAHDFITTGIGKYQITCKICGTDIDGMTLISHVVIKYNLMGY